MSQTNLLITDSGLAVKVANQSAAPSRDGAKLAFAFLWLFTFVVYARPQDIFPVINPFHLPLVFGTCAGLAYLGALISGRAHLQWPRELVLVLLLTAWFILGVPFAHWRGGSFNVLTETWLKTLFILFLLIQTLTTVSRVRKLLWAIILSELMAVSASLVFQGNEAIWEGGRLFGFNQGILGWNFLGIAAAVTIPYIAALYISHRSLLRTGLLLTVVALMMWMLVLTASRGGFLNVIFSFVLTWWFVLRPSPRGRAAGLMVALCLFMAVAKAPDVFWLRLQSIWNASEATSNPTVASAEGSTEGQKLLLERAEGSTEGRKLLLERAVKYTLQYPIFGVGLGNFPVINGTELARPSAWMSTHNTFTQVSSEAGIPALLLFLSILATVLRHSKRAIKRFTRDPADVELNLLARATLVSVVSFAFGGFFANLAYEYYFFYLAAIAAGLDYMAQRMLQTLSAQTANLSSNWWTSSIGWSP